jgi:hypothetical protein
MRLMTATASFNIRVAVSFNSDSKVIGQRGYKGGSKLQQRQQGYRAAKL